MTFILLKNFLSRAFSRIDGADKNHGMREQGEVVAAARHYLFAADIDYRNGTLIIYSASAAEKQKTFLSKKNILQKINTHLGRSLVRDIMFRGPRR